MKTPISDPEHFDHLDHLDPLDAIIAAWTEPGPNPMWNERAQQAVRSAMPLLARALDRAAREAQR